MRRPRGSRACAARSGSTIRGTCGSAAISGAAPRRHGAVDLPERASGPAILGRLGATVELAVVALLLATLVGVTLGVVAAIRQGGIIDTIAMLFAQLGVSIPVYWLALLLMLSFCRASRLAARDRSRRAAAGGAGRGADRQPGADPRLAWHIALPALALGANSAAIISRLGAHLDARGAARGLRPHRPRQGPAPARAWS